MSISRRAFIRGAGAAVALTAVDSVGGTLGGPETSPAASAATPRLPPTYDDRVIDTDWRFGRLPAGTRQPVDRIPPGWETVTLPHTVVPLGYHAWDYTTWEGHWGYARAVDLRDGSVGRRTFVDFDGVLTSTHVAFNGEVVGQHVGGYVPFSFEVTDLCRRGANLLSLAVDTEFEGTVPPGQVTTAGTPPERTIDFLQPGGLYRAVHLRTAPDAYVYDLFVDPQVSGPDGPVTAQVTLDAASAAGRHTVTVSLFDGTATPVRTATAAVTVSRGRTVASLQLRGAPLELWSPEHPARYTATATLSAAAPIHAVEIATGFRRSSFAVAGYELNGSRRVLLGLSRHQLYPWSGHAMPAAAQAADVDLLKDELNVDFVRCVHYPPDPAFLDACDQRGLLVWEETPGWGNLGPGGSGDRRFDELWAANNTAMVLRDRSRPSVIVWGTHPNEAPLDPSLDRPRAELATRLDPGRPTSGAVERYAYAADRYVQQVVAVNDYQSGFVDRRGGYTPRTAEQLPATAYVEPPERTKPWLVTEAVGALLPPYLHFQNATQYAAMSQGIYHAQVHDQVQRPGAGYVGLAAWTAIDYQSDWSYDPAHPGLRSPGVVDTFRNAKRAAGFYRSQGDPRRPGGPVLALGFAWWFDLAGAPSSGLGAGDTTSVTCLTDPDLNVAGRGRGVVWSNCDEVRVLLDDQPAETIRPDRSGFPHLAHPPLWMDLGGIRGRPTLTLRGYVDGAEVAERRFAPDASSASLTATADRSSILGDGSDATRVAVLAVDRYGNHLPYVTGACAVAVTGGELVGLGAGGFDLGDTGGSGAVWVRAAASSRPGGAARVTFTHPTLGRAAASVRLT